MRSTDTYRNNRPREAREPYALRRAVEAVRPEVLVATGKLARATAKGYGYHLWRDVTADLTPAERRWVAAALESYRVFTIDEDGVRFEARWGETDSLVEWDNSLCFWFPTALSDDY